MIISKLAGREILTILFGQNTPSEQISSWIMAAGSVLLWPSFGIRMTAAGYYNSQVVLNILANLSLLAACYWLVARQGC